MWANHKPLDNPFPAIECDDFHRPVQVCETLAEKLFQLRLKIMFEKLIQGLNNCVDYF